MVKSRTLGSNPSLSAENLSQKRKIESPERVPPSGGNESKGRKMSVVEGQNMFKDDSRWFVYMLCCSDGSYYVGVATDVAHRLHQHNAGQAVAFTKERRPVELVYVEGCGTYLAARRREKQLKGWRREKKELLISGFPSTRPV